MENRTTATFKNGALPSDWIKGAVVLHEGKRWRIQEIATERSPHGNTIVTLALATDLPQPGTGPSPVAVPAPAARPGGRPSKMTPDRVEKILAQVANGVPPYQAARAAGLNERTYFLWMKLGREAMAAVEDIEELDADRKQYAHFFESVETALAEAESKMVLTIAKESSNTWQAAAWILERRFPERYARRDKLDANVNGTMTLTYTESVQAAWRRRNERQQLAEPEAITDGTDSDV